MTISGTITYDSVPHNPTTSGLNYNATEQLPARGVTVQLLNGSGSVLETTQTDATGDYSFSVASDTNVRVRARAEIVETGTPGWDVSVTDNTNSNALYVLSGSLTSSGTADSTRDLHAASGWGGTSYTSTRAAAPFAILDPLYDAVNEVTTADPTAVLPPIELRWSTDNRAVRGDLTIGEIGTSFYNGTAIYLLGDENSDTDEYDSSVVVHEWGHYLEDNVSRSDSIGGSHGGTDSLDPRVAWGEGFANALSGMILQDPIYTDSRGAQQASGFSINMETASNSNEGWFNERTVQMVVYDIWDSNPDGVDNLNLGFVPIYSVLTSSSYTGSEYFTTIFNFLDELASQNPGAAAQITAIAADQSVNGTGHNGAGETNTGGYANALPVYSELTPGQTARVCSTDTYGSYNKLGNRDFVTVTFPSAGTHTITMSRVSGPTGTDPDFVIYRDGQRIVVSQDATADSETYTGAFQADTYVIDTYDFVYADGGSTYTGEICFDFSVSN
ncbi:MAG: hypothetical protein CMK04_02420 [Ponticaulis sp.]|nr:hypothetical protein [Ponticaulis sp.]HBH88947.1 hypothetical protein [Hyphomonadaceae bacterium]